MKGGTLRSDWYEDDRSATLYPNAAVVAAAQLGANLEQTVIATMRAAMNDGAKLGRRDVAVETVARIASVDAAALDRLLDSAEVGRELNFGNAELQRIGCSERPSWFIENANGDHVAMQGVWQKDAVLATIGALRADEEAYAKAGTPPA